MKLSLPPSYFSGRIYIWHRWPVWVTVRNENRESQVSATQPTAVEIEQQFEPLRRRADQVGVSNRNNTEQQNGYQIETSSLENSPFNEELKTSRSISTHTEPGRTTTDHESMYWSDNIHLKTPTPEESESNKDEDWQASVESKN